jgi:hypothetical protein
MKKYIITYRNGVNLCKFEKTSNLGLDNVLEYFKNEKNGLHTIQNIEVLEVDSLLQIIEDTAPYNQDEPTQETKPFTKEEQAAYWQAEHELIQQQTYDEAMYFKGKVLDIPNHLR